jgi:TRAP-type C4-dicarboxylate transport system substrate-binding protein
MKTFKSSIIIMVLLLLIPVFASACKTTEPAPATTPTTPTTPAKPALEPIELSLASLYPPASAPSQSLERWAEKIKTESNGLLTIRHYPAGTLIAPPDMRNGVKSGVADLGFSFIYKPEPGFEPSMVMSQLILGLNYANCLKIFDDLWNEFPELWEGQWSNFKLIDVSTAEANLLFTTKKPVRSLKDLKGLQIRVPSATVADLFTALGAAPVSMSTADWVISLDKGTTDGASVTFSSLSDYKIAEKLKYYTYYSTGPGISFLIMNKDTWNSLSPDLQKVIDNNSDWIKQEMIQSKMATEKEGIEYAKSSGGEFITLSENEYARWDAAVKPVYDKIAADLNAAGYPGTELVNYALERAKYYYSK